MTTTTPNLGLTLYDSSTDTGTTFATFRAVWGGPASTSNFYKIDTAYGVQAGQITALQNTRGAISVPALFSSSNYYVATGISTITAYTAGMTILLSVDTTSNGTVTLNINSLGILSVMKVDSTGTPINLTGSDLVKGRQYLFMYDGARWLWVSANSADQIQIVGTSGNVVTVGSTNNLDGSLTQSLLMSQTTHSATAKTTLADNDETNITDSAASYVLKRITWANIKTAIGIAFGVIIDAVTAKTTPVGADEFVIADSAATFASKKITLTNIAAYLSSLSETLTNKTLTSPVISTISNTGTLTLPTSTDTLVGRNTTDTLTNKRITSRESTTASSSTPTPDSDTTDIYTVTALAAGATFGAPTGTPTQGQKLIIRIKDNGTARALSWNAIYRIIGTTLPTTTTISKTIYVGFIYNSTDTKWDCVAVAQEA